MRAEKQLLNLLVFIRVYSIIGLKKFELFGDDAFGKRYTPYPAQFKLVVLNYRETAAIFNIPSYETLRKWKIAYETRRILCSIIKEKGASIHEKLKIIRPQILEYPMKDQ